MDTIEEENPFGIQSLKGPHSPSITSYAPAFLAGEIGRWKRVAKTEGHHYVYTPLLGHPPRPRPLSGIHPALCWATPALYPASMRPLSGTYPPPSDTRLPSIGHPFGCPGVHLPCSPIGYREPSWPLRRASPSGPLSNIEFFSSISLLTTVFIHFPKSSSTIQKVHPPSKKCIRFPKN
jgi:hypothetical protein